MFYFLHISKCAGTSFIGMAERNAGLLQPHLNGKPLNPLTGQKLSFWRWSPVEQSHFMSSGLWGMIVNETTMGEHAGFYKGVTYITILRDPIDRLFSAYQYLRRQDETLPLAERGRNFARFLEEEFGPYWRRNYLTTALTYRERKSSRERLELAKQRLSQFDHVFFVETLPRGIDALAHYGWSELALPRRNVFAAGEHGLRWSAAREALSDHPRLLAQLLEQNEQDLELYAFARDLPARSGAGQPADRKNAPEQRAVPPSENFEFLSSRAYEAFLKEDMPFCLEMLARMEKLPEAAEVARDSDRGFAEMALSRFRQPMWAAREYRRKIRERWTSRLGKEPANKRLGQSRATRNRAQSRPNAPDEEHDV